LISSARRPQFSAAERRPILVAGNNGQLARCLVEQALARDVQLIAFGRPQLDLTNPESIEHVVAAVQPRAIVNAAACTAVDRAEAEPRFAFAVNCDGAGRLAAAAARLRVPFIHISTDYVFDGSKEGPYREDDIPLPVNAYGRSKLEGETAVLDAYSAALVLRTSWLFSRWGHNFLKMMLSLAENGHVIRVVNDQRGTPTSGYDLAGAILDLETKMNENKDQAGIYHLAAAGETTWHGFAAAILAGWARRGRPVPALKAIATSDDGRTARRPANSCLDCAKINRIFGIRLPSWQACLDATLDASISARAESIGQQGEKLSPH